MLVKRHKKIPTGDDRNRAFVYQLSLLLIEYGFLRQDQQPQYIEDAMERWHEKREQSAA